MKLLGILIFALSFTQCKSTKLDTTPSFTIKSASYSHISGGLPGNKVLNLMIEFTTSKTIDFQNVYFQNRVINALIEEKQGKKYIAARYKISANKKDLILNVDPKEEFGNTNSIKEKLPFELKENEAALSYKIGNKIIYYKIENIKKEKRVFMN